MVLSKKDIAYLSELKTSFILLNHFDSSGVIIFSASEEFDEKIFKVLDSTLFKSTNLEVLRLLIIIVCD